MKLFRSSKACAAAAEEKKHEQVPPLFALLHRREEESVDADDAPADNPVRLPEALEEIEIGGTAAEAAPASPFACPAAQQGNSAAAAQSQQLGKGQGEPAKGVDDETPAAVNSSVSYRELLTRVADMTARLTTEDKRASPSQQRTGRTMHSPRRLKVRLRFHLVAAGQRRLAFVADVAFGRLGFNSSASNPPTNHHSV